MDDLIDISKINKLEPIKGRVLLSEPFMLDEYFKRSVVLLCEHNEDGSFGFVINNFLSVSLSEIVDQIKMDGFTVSFGGPVNSSNLYYVHTLHYISEAYEIVPGLFTGGKFEEVATGINTGTIHESEIRFFLGYSGWDAEQLNGEIVDNAWLIGDAKLEDIMSPAEDLWKNILKRMGGKFKMISNFPEDPTLN